MSGGVVPGVASLEQTGVSCAPMPLALATDAELAHALEAARLHFEPQMGEIMRAIRRSLRGRDPRELVGRECLRHLEVRAKFTEIADEQVAFAGMLLARRRQRIAA